MFMYINDDLHKREVLRRSAILVVQPTTKHCLPFYTTNRTKKTVTNKWKNKEKKTNGIKTMKFNIPNSTLTCDDKSNLN